MTTESQQPQVEFVPLDRVIFDKPMTAGDMLLMAARSNMQLLAQAAVLKADEPFRFNANMTLIFKGSDVLHLLRSNGFVIEQTAAVTGHQPAEDEGSAP